ncbi:MAG TPA: hypothetical protein VFB93_12450 [Burkholderiales bacterium]|nr:hypothetical protein [Burkholderiales bacterium]
MTRWTVFLAVAAAAALLAWWWSETPGVDSTAPVVQAQEAAPAPKPADRNSLELQGRALSNRWGDLFASPAKPAPPKPVPVVQLPEPLKAPPLPFRYDGSGELQGKRFVYLARDGRSSTMVSAGDMIDGTYRVENVARDHAVLRYLPLGERQVLMYQAGAAVPPELAAAPSPSRPAELRVDIPAEVILGQEFVVTVLLPGGGALKANVEVVYDAEVLSMVGAGLPRPGGRAVVQVANGSSRAELRFKVLADSPASTDITVQVNATDASGKRVPVWAPTAHTVSLVQPGA